MRAYYFNISATRAFGGVSLQKIFFSPMSVVLYAIMLSPFIQMQLVENDPLPMIVAATLVLFGLHVLRTFNRELLLNDEREEIESRNLSHLLSSDMVRMLMREKKLTAFTLLRAAVSTPRGKFVMNEIGISAPEFLAQFEQEVSKQIDVYGFLVKAKELRDALGEARIDANVIIYFFFQHGGDFKQLLNEKDLSLDDLKKIMQWERFHFDWLKEHRTWSPRKILRYVGTLGRSWVMGYTDELDRITTDISENILFRYDRKIVIQQQEIENVMHVLSRSEQQNVIILGKPGVGKRTLVENVTYRIRKHERDHSLPFTRVLNLHTEELLSGSANPETILLNAMKRADGAGRFILIMEDISLLFKSANENLLAVMTKFLNAPNISIIGIADVQDYHSMIKKSPSLDILFEKINVNDSSDDETMMVMMTHYFQLEEKRHMHMTFKALKSILDLSKRYIGKGGFPGKAISVLNDAMLSAKRRGDNFVTETDVREMVSLKAHVNVREISEDEKTRLLHLEESLREKVIGQDVAIRALVNTLKRARLDIQNKNKPLGTFLFLGPTGVGKTETAKVLAEEFFGSRDNMIRLDMNEYSNEDSTKLIIGSPESGGELSEGFLAKRVQDHPFSLVLLDEIEKAHPKVLNLFLQILDEGVLNDSLGVRTDFRNTIIIATSNAGALFIRDFIKEHQELSREDFKQSLIDTILKQNTFSPEFINRFDEVLLYYPLSQNDALKVAVKMIDDIIADLHEKRGIILKMEEGVVTAIAEKGYSQEFGAREMRRTITDLLENFLADYMLRHDVKRGEEIFIRKDDLLM